MNSDQLGEKGARKTKRDRYWSVMLVGDHGRIIPFRRFKELAIGGICLLVISMAALIAVSIFSAHQKKKIAHLQSELAIVRQQAAQLRDEKDLYLTQLVVKQGQKTGPSKQTTPAEEAKAGSPPTAEAADPPPMPVAKMKPAPAKVKWAADIRRFKATYLPDQKVLKAEFRIYNTSRPKKPLSGRTVVVFKNLDDTPIHWFPVPRVQLTNGEPSGSRGQSFKINNFRTVQFRAYGQKSPVMYNSATVFIYSEKGELLVSKDFGYKIDYKPPAKSATPKIPPKPSTAQPTSSVTPPVANDSSGVPVQSPATSGPPSAGPNTSQEASAPPATQTSDNAGKAADESVVSPDASAPTGKSKPPATGMAGDETPSSSAPSAPPADAPDTDSKPKTQGEQP